MMTFALPFLALSFLYTSIGVKTFKHIIPGNADSARDEAQLRTKIKVSKNTYNNLMKNKSIL
jgi:hypothetical protein